MEEVESWYPDMLNLVNLGELLKIPLEDEQEAEKVDAKVENLQTRLENLAEKLKTKEQELNRSMLVDLSFDQGEHYLMRWIMKTERVLETPSTLSKRIEHLEEQATGARVE